MKLLALLPLAVLAADVVAASVVPARHHRLARRLSRKKRCLARPPPINIGVHSSSTSPPVTYPTSTPPPAQQQSTTTTTNQAPPAASPPPAQDPPRTGTINVASTCGDIGATTDPSKTSGPNGSIYWLNCGIQDGSGWRPPNFSVDQVITKDLGTVLSNPGNPYEPCRPYLDAFYQAANSHHVPAILLAAIAMQESSCNPGAIGANGEQGLMQITPDKCPDNHGSEACREPYFNIDAGAKYLSNTLNGVGGNLPQAVGQYNGWVVGMSFNDATRARYQGNCFAQNNLDYLHQTFNGWLQGVDPRALGMGAFFNLDGC